MVTIRLCQNIKPGMFWHKQIIAKLYQGYILALYLKLIVKLIVLQIVNLETNCSETILGVCFGYEFCMPKHTPSIFVRGGIFLPVTLDIRTSACPQYKLH